MPEDDTRCVSHDAACVGIVAPLLCDDLGTHQPRIEHPGHGRDGDIHVQQPRPQRGNDCDDQHKERDGDQQIHEPAEQRIGQAACVTDQRARKGAEHRGEQRAEDGNLQVDARCPDSARQDVASEIVSAERMRCTRRLQQRVVVECIGRIWRDPVWHQRTGDHANRMQCRRSAPLARRRCIGKRAAACGAGCAMPPSVEILGSSSACNASIARNTTETSTHSTMVSP